MPEAKINEEEKKPYSPEGRKLFCTAGRLLFEQGTPANQAYFIDEGRVEITVTEGPHVIRVGELGPGDIFGETGILENKLRMATVTAIEDTTVTVITRENLQSRIDAIPDEFIKALITSMSHRVSQSTRGQVRYYTDLATFQDRMSGLMQKASEGIDQAQRDAFAREAIPLLDQLEALLDKYRK